MDDGRGQQQRLAEAGLPRHQQNVPPPVRRFDRQQAHGEVTETSGDEEKQNEPADDTSPRGLGLL